jgi:quinol monooxygenase YgiN
MLTFVATIKVKQGTEQDAEGALRKMIDYVKTAEPGTVRYTLHRHPKDATRFLMYEQYVSKDAMDAHSQTDAIKQLFGTLGPILDGAPSLEVWEETDGKK